MRLFRHRDLFALSEEELVGANLPEFYIDTGDNLPIRTKPYRYGPQQTKFIQDTIDSWEHCGIVSKATNSNTFSSPLVLPKRKDGGQRVCVDFRRLNAVT